MKKVPLTYEGVQIGEAEVSDDNSRIDAYIFDEHAHKLIGPGNYSLGFNTDIAAGTTVRLFRPEKTKEQ